MRPGLLVHLVDPLAIALATNLDRRLSNGGKKLSRLCKRLQEKGVAAWSLSRDQEIIHGSEAGSAVIATISRWHRREELLVRDPEPCAVMQWLGLRYGGAGLEKMYKNDPEVG